VVARNIVQSGPESEKKNGLFVSVSNLNRLAKFFHYSKGEEISNARHVLYFATLPCVITGIFEYNANLEENKTKYINFAWQNTFDLP